MSPTRGASSRISRVALRPGMESSRSVAAVARLDGRTRVVAVRDRAGWRPGSRQPWTTATAAQLRSLAVDEVLLRRRFRRARVLLAWLPAWAD